MNKLKIMITAWLLAFLATPAEALFDDMHEFKLDNGLQVVVIENHKAPIVKQMVFYKAGSMDEAIGKGGVAHLLEHLMFRGTERLKDGKFNDLMEQNGVVSNAFTSQDVTAYHQFCDLSRLEMVMFAEADRMRGLQFSDEALTSEKQIVAEERLQRVDNNPAAKFYEAVKKTLWQSHPYSRQVAGELEEIAALKRDDVEEFYQRYYAPNNAVLVFSGDVDAQSLSDKIEKYYGKTTPVEMQHKEGDKLPDGYRAKIEMKLKDVKLPRMVRVYATPSFNYKPEMVYALEVLSEYMGGDKNSPFYQRMVMFSKAALDVDVGYNPMSRSYGTLEVVAVPKEKATDDFAALTDRAWDYALRKLDEENLAMTKDKILADLVYTEDNPANAAELAGMMAAQGIDLRVLQDYEQNIRKVSLEDVLAAGEYLRTQAPVVTGLLNGDDEL
ncbi:MAG: insulinase family protein [Alphaproteobacteria bacterium]|nr:insulinase family protein [Alphaproteobacteria bacterium]